MKSAIRKKHPEFSLKNAQRTIKVDIDKIKQPLARKPELFVSPPEQIGIVLVSNAKIKKLNRTFLGKNTDTDILSFKLSVNYGEIIISAEKACENSRIYGITTEEEILYLIVHGYLHIKNYRDYTEQEKRTMFGKQDAIFKNLSVERKSSVNTAGQKPVKGRAKVIQLTAGAQAQQHDKAKSGKRSDIILPGAV